MVNAMMAVAPAQAGATQPPPPWTNLVIFIPLLVVFWLVLLRPQQKKAKEHAQMLKAIRAGDKIVTSGGILATVVTVKDKSLNVRSGDAKFEITKSAVGEIVERGGESSES